MRGSQGAKFRRLLVCLAIVPVVLVVASPAAQALGVAQCTGFSGCAAAGYSNFGYSSVYTTSYWGQDAGHNCTNYVAYRFSAAGVGKPSWIGHGNADQWGIWASSITNSTPTVGSIAWWGPSSAEEQYGGHVSIVQQVNADGTFLDSDDNYGGDFHWRKYSPGADWPSGFIHLNDAALGGASEGAFVQVSGQAAIYRIAGGAPMYVSTWDAYGGTQRPYIVISQGQFDALRPYPADGTYISDTSSGRVYRVAGGAPEYVSAADASSLPGWGSQPVIELDHYDFANFDHLLPYPTDGTFISNVDVGRVYKVAGGAPEYVSAADAASVPGYNSGSSVVVLSGYEFANFDHLRAYPVDGTFISNVDNGRVYRVAGGAPEYVSAADASSVPGWGTQPVIVLSGYEFSFYEHLRPYPADGTLVRNVDNGDVFVVAGGAPEWISGADANQIPGFSAAIVNLSGYEFSQDEHLRPVPADGTFVTTTAGNAYVIAGGAVFAITDWSVYGGKPAGVPIIDQWTVDNAGASTIALRPAPAAGTIVKGLPSDHAWSFSSTCRTATDDSGGTEVPDSAVSAYPACATSVSSVSPPSGSTQGGSSVVITGTGFDGASAVSFGTVSASSFTVDSDSQVTAVTPAHALGQVNVFVTGPAGKSLAVAGDKFVFVKPPAVTGVSPSSGPPAGGTTVTITGTGFTGATKVSFGTIAATSFTVNSATQITAVSPMHAAGSLNVFVTTGNGTSAAVAPDKFTYLKPPAVTGVSPSSGPTAGGTTVTITGTGFTGATKVSFGTVAATSFTVNSATQITVVSPSHAAGTPNVFVTTANGTSPAAAADKFTYQTS